MPILAKEPQRDFTPPPEGLYRGCCCDVVDLGVMDSGFGPKHKVRLFWQLEPDENGRRAVVTRTYTLTLNEKAALRKDLDLWRGKKMTDAERTHGFDLESMIGVGCQIQVTHRLGDKGGVFANVTAVMPLSKGQANPSIDGYERKSRP